MEAVGEIVKRRKAVRSKWLWTGVVVAVIIVLIVVIVPCAIILPRKHQPKGLRSTVLLPLYIYPQDGSWDPLYNALTTHTSLDFLIVLNPDDGPGNGSVPSDEYIAAIEKVNGYSNVQTVGYVHTDYATRNISLVLADVATYSGWASNSSSLAVQGIFFDEAPHVYSSAKVEYMATINQAVKNSTGIQGNQTIIHNPGTIPDAAYNDTSTDITVVFEESYAKYTTQSSALSSLDTSRSSNSYIVHSVGSSVSLSKTVKSMSQHAEYLFLTDRTEDYYEGFGSDWGSFLDVMPV